MNDSTKRKFEQHTGGAVEVEWVDDNEWNAIESAFDALSKPGANRQSRHSSGIVTTSPMVLSAILPSFSVVSPRSGSTGHSPNSSLQYKRDYFPRNGIQPNGEGWGHSSPFTPRYDKENISPHGSRTRRNCAKESPDFPSSDTAVEERTELDSRPGEQPLVRNFVPGYSLPELSAPLFASRGEMSGIIQAAVQEIQEKSVRKLPFWMQASVHGAGIPVKNSSSVEEVRAILGLDEDTVSETVGEQEPRRAHGERGKLGLTVQPTGSGYPIWLQAEQPLPFGLQPFSFVDQVKPKLPAIQFRGQIVYSKTESEVNAATDELWRRVRELQQTGKSAIPIGFDLEWKTTYEKGVVPNKVAVMQLCLDRRRCDVIQIIYSGIPLALQNLLEAPSTLKVEKIKSIRCGDWEALPLSEPQLQYAATDAFASLHCYQILASFPNPEKESKQSGGDSSKSPSVRELNR